MQTLMIKFDQLVRRHRRAVLALWLIALLAAVPFAMRQSENLTGGGSPSLARSRRRSAPRSSGTSPSDSRATLAAVLVPRDGAPEAADARGDR